MPLIANTTLPSFQRLKDNGYTVLSSDRAQHQDIRELHIGLLNMMPDGALQATERQFLRLITSCNTIAQFYVHLFSLPSIERGHDAKAHIEKYYESFQDIKQEGLDVLIITGANPAKPNLYEENFWDEMIEVFEWAQENVASTLCSCLASHASFKIYYDIDRRRLDKKCWGVYSHRVIKDHPLVNNVNTRFDVPHSRNNQVDASCLEAVGMHVLVSSDDVDFHLATSKDGFRTIFLQGHPEYGRNSILKEYKREIVRYFSGERSDYPVEPEHYFTVQGLEKTAQHKKRVISARNNRESLPEFPEKELIAFVDNTWWDTGKAIFNNWLGLVYQLINVDRKKVFMDGVDPENPLKLNFD